jgi:hypothetical protein
VGVGTLWERQVLLLYRFAMDDSSDDGKYQPTRGVQHGVSNEWGEEWSRKLHLRNFMMDDCLEQLVIFGSTSPHVFGGTLLERDVERVSRQRTVDASLPSR